MGFTAVTQNEKAVAVISGGEAVLRDGPSTLEEPPQRLTA